MQAVRDSSQDNVRQDGLQQSAGCLRRINGARSRRVGRAPGGKPQATGAQARSGVNRYQNSIKTSGPGRPLARVPSGPVSAGGVRRRSGSGSYATAPGSTRTRRGGSAANPPPPIPAPGGLAAVLRAASTPPPGAASRPPAAPSVAVWFTARAFAVADSAQTTAVVVTSSC